MKRLPIRAAEFCWRFFDSGRMFTSLAVQVSNCPGVSLDVVPDREKMEDRGESVVAGLV